MLTPNNIPAVEPEIVYAGQTIKWTRSLSDYPSDEYTLKYYLSGPAYITLTGSQYESTLDHLISVSAATSASWTYGIYSYQAFAEKTGEKWIVGSGDLTIKSAAGKSFAKTMLDAIETILAGRATTKDLDVVAKGIGDKNIAKKPEILMQWRDKFRKEYQAEQNKENMLMGKRVVNRILTKL